MCLLHLTLDDDNLQYFPFELPLIHHQYRVGQLYMIARHSLEQSGEDGVGVAVVENRQCVDDVHGEGQYTEKHIHLSAYDIFSIPILCLNWFIVCVCVFSLDCDDYIGCLFSICSIYTDDCLIGYKPFVPRSFMSLRSHGTIIRIRLQVCISISSWYSEDSQLYTLQLDFFIHSMHRGWSSFEQNIAWVSLSSITTITTTILIVFFW